MKLTDQEKSMLQGEQGRAKARAMDLLVRYGEALGAERLVETNNVAGAFNASTPSVRELAKKGFDAVYSELNLDSPEIVEVPHMVANTCQLITGIDNERWRIQGISEDLADQQKQAEAYFGRRGINMFATCTPYQVGNVPVKGEHCAWMESSAVVYCNSVLGARTNTEGKESTGAAALTGRIPYWGYHVTENRRGTHLVEVELDVDDIMDWGLLGYYLGEIVDDEIPVLTGRCHQPSLIKLKHFGAAAASSGGVEMYHIPEVTPEARSIEEAFGGNAIKDTLQYGAAERRIAYENLNCATDRNVDFVMLGCPHNSIDQVSLIASLLEGRKISLNTQLWVHTPRALREVADRNGYTSIIGEAGGVVMSDTCPAISRHMPRGTKVVATDSAKQAHYLPAITGVSAWFGSVRDCIEAALTGRWNGGLA
ncbi:aconitase X catalytic domain-containing protein [Bradyrhizobium sp.]|uniref:aconitase X catalytic domain-containing protein n=1 Tax=Bradyrhizobium sp. TaxID=376 RepID=UPI001EBFEFEB|nr:aconitase X catalytic domain-containing protein [Bradyrhizobium sp.]MBV9983305.1 aconitase X catalytic domain-containing protein [Bradyrhizobium sp.]